ncbi:hypothetical protein Tco_0528055 [Tanacetum coccineum]
MTDRSNFIVSYNNHLIMTTLAEHMIVIGVENRPPMLDKTMYNSWQSRILLYIKGKKNGLPPDVYSLVNHCKVANDIWDKVKLLMQGTELSYQERECKLYNEFDKFTSSKGESLYEYYLSFTQLINDMYTIGMTMQYEDPLALVANYQTQSNSSLYPQQLSSIPQTTHSSQPYLPTYEAPHHP